MPRQQLDKWSKPISMAKRGIANVVKNGTMVAKWLDQ
jgi:hypothetical protein